MGFVTRILFPAIMLFALALPALSAAQSATAYTAQGIPLISINPIPLIKDNFQPFGQLIEAAEGIKPTVSNATLRCWAGLAKARIHEAMEFSVFTVQAREHEVAEMERHNRSPELLVSLEGDSILVLAPHSPPKTGRAHPDPLQVKAFVMRQGQAVILSKGCWHALPFPLSQESKFLAGFRDGTAQKDLVIRPFRKSVLIKF
jgi:ureidoglycolate lyase